MNYSDYVEQLDINLKAQSYIDEKKCVFYNIKTTPEFDIYGLYNPKEQDEYIRVPMDKCKQMSLGMEYFSKNTSGGRIRFKTNSKTLGIRVTMPEIHVRNMCYAGSAGFDVYVDGKRTSDYYRTFIPPFGFGKNDSRTISSVWQGVITFPTKRERYITINFPLYNIVEKVEIALDKKATLGHGKAYTYSKPIIFYGSSITQGGAASKPGNDSSHMVSRYFDCDFINLGFSGSGRGEIQMAQFIGGIDASMLILEYDHNAPSVEHLAKTHYPFYKTVRDLKPNMPIILVSKPDFYATTYYVTNQKQNVQRRQVVLDTYERAIKEGDKNVYFIDGKTLFNGDYYFDCTVDGTHLNDLGFYRVAKKYIAFIKKNGLLK